MKKSKRNIQYLVIHCTATKEGASFRAKDIDRWHRDKGWKEIGYNYVIGLDGNIEEGRDVDKIPSQVKGYNEHAIGIVYVGGLNSYNGQPKDTRTPAQKQRIIELLRKLKAMYPQAKILGHRDFPHVQKACPCFDAQKEYSLL